MRQRLVNEKAVAKTKDFLISVYAKCMTGTKFTFAELYKKHGVSKATGSALSKLGIVEEKSGIYIWKKASVNREMALQVLELLRLRNDKMVAVPLDGFESLVDDLKQLVLTLKENNMVENKTITIEQAKHEDFMKIVAAVSNGAYSRFDLEKLENKDIVSDFNSAIISAANDLLTKIYK